MKTKSFGWIETAEKYGDHVITIHKCSGKTNIIFKSSNSTGHIKEYSISIDDFEKFVDDFPKLKKLINEHDSVSLK